MIQTIEINVTQERINKSEKSTMCHCPIALATNQRLEPEGEEPILITGASVSSHEATFSAIQKNEPVRYYAFALPKEAVKFIQDRDAGEEVAPFSFIAKPKEYTPKMATT